MLLVWGLGAAIGPFIAALAMTRYGAASLFLVNSAVHIVFLGFSVYLMLCRPSMSPAEKTSFVPQGLGRTTPTGAELDPRADQSREAV